jgi:preprotein translocase subunit SecF
MSTVDTDSAPAEAQPKRANALVRLYRGETHFDFVGRRRWWFLISGIVIVAGLISLGTRGLNFGIDFKGGSSWTVAANGATVTEVTNAVTKAGLPDPTVQIIGTGSRATVQVQADINNLPSAQQTKVNDAVTAVMAGIGHESPDSVTFSNVGPTWGSQITNKAIIAVIVFFAVVVVYISFRFEWKMAIAALIAVLHDLLVVVGVYSLSGFQVTSDTVIAVLTILGYSLYDTVVVFDRVADNTKGLGASGRMTYEDVVNLSMNQTLARSINTSLVAILPVLSVLVIGAQILGATTLQYFGLALVIGLISGAYSSIFIASPVLAMMKERESRYANIRQKLANRSDRTGLLTPRAAAMLAAAGASGGVRAVSGSGGKPVARKGAKPGSRGRPAARSGGQGAGGQGGVLRPGTASAKQARNAVAEIDESDEFDAAAGNGADGAGNGAGAQKATAQRAASGAPRSGGGGANAGARRPGPRPRKGKSSRKGRRR